MNKNICSIFITFMILILPLSAHADWLDLLKGAFETATESETGQRVINSALTNEEVIQGLKQALDKGVRTSVNYLGKQDGFWASDEFRIPLPNKLQTVEKTMRTLGMGDKADEFKLSLNRAAENAVPQATDIFLNSIKQMQFDDAKEILNGSNTAATDYLKRNSSGALVEKFLPIVSNVTAKTGVTSQYKSLVGQLDMFSGLVDLQSLDIDYYVTNKAVDALFMKIAQEETLIRQNPVKRTTDLLRKVFQ